MKEKMIEEFVDLAVSFNGRSDYEPHFSVKHTSLSFTKMVNLSGYLGLKDKYGDEIIFLNMGVCEAFLILQEAAKYPFKNAREVLWLLLALKPEESVFDFSRQLLLKVLDFEAIEKLKFHDMKMGDYALLLMSKEFKFTIRTRRPCCQLYRGNFELWPEGASQSEQVSPEERLWKVMSTYSPLFCKLVIKE